MNPLLRRLAILRLKVRLLDGWQGICALITLVFAVGVSVGALDYWVHLPTLPRAVALVGLLVGAAGIFYRYVVRPFGKPCDDLNLALRIEEAHPELNDALASTVQFMNMKKEDQARLGASESMRARTVADMMDQSSKYDFGSILDRRAGILFGVAALCVLGITAWLGAYNRANAETAFLRLIEPFGMHTWTKVAVYRPAPFDASDADKEKKWELLDARDAKPDRIAIGRPYIIKVVLTGQIPKQARVEIDAKIRSDMNVTKLIPGEDGQSAFFVTPINMTQQYQTFKFRVVANDGAFPPRAGAWHEVEVMHKPKLIDLNGAPSPQITVYPPAYTDLPSPAKLLAGVKHLEVYLGSRAVYHAKADRPLTQALIRWQPEDSTLMELAQLGAGVAVWDKAIATIDPRDKSIFSIPLFPWASGSYVLYMRDEYGLETEEVADIRVLRDPVPVVKLLRPAASAEFAPDAVVPFKFLVSDEKFAVRSVYVEFARKAQDGTPIDDNPTSVVLYDAQTHGKLVPWQLAQALGARALSPDLRLRQTKLNFDLNWALKNHRFKEGQVVVVEVFADDFCDIDPNRKPGKSHAIELRIVSKRAIKGGAERTLGDIQRDLEKALKQERKALETVKEIRNESKIDQAVKDKLIDGADQPQKDVAEIIGTSTEGVRGDLNKLLDKLKANNLDNSKAYQEAKKIKGALDNVAQEELLQIKPKLDEIRADLSQNDKINPKTKAKLGETAKLQQNVVNTLEELIARMDPGAKMRDIRDQVREIISKQQDLREEAQKLSAENQQAELKKTPEQHKESVEKDFKKKVQQKAAEQQQLSERLDNVLKEMAAEQKQQEKLGNTKEAEQIKKAIEQIKNQESPKKPMPEESKKDLPLPAQMKEVARDLKDKGEAPKQALDKQQKISDQLEQALKTLEGRDPDLAKEGIKDRKDAAKEIQKEINELKRLREEDKKADQIKDMQERLKKKQEIAEQMAKLQENMEKTRRQLAQLQEQTPAKAMKEGIDKLEQAQQKLEQGGNAEQELRQAEKDLREAKDNLKESEEQLAREMLIKMADQLKGLKERQDASLKRTEDLHPKVLKRKSWTDALLGTMEGNLDSQKGIAEETDGLKEKLKGTVVFEGILERAKKSMDNAGELMKARHDEGLNRRFFVDGKEMGEDEVKDEIEWQTDTVRYQKQAGRSLTNLLDALKEEIDKPKKPRVAKDDKNPEKDPPEKEEPPRGIQGGDGIPPTAQLKALKAEQIDLNERTIDFNNRHPDPAKYEKRQIDELRELEAEQDRLQRLFQRLTAPPQQEGDQP